MEYYIGSAHIELSLSFPFHVNAILNFNKTPSSAGRLHITDAIKSLPNARSRADARRTPKRNQ